MNQQGVQFRAKAVIPVNNVVPPPLVWKSDGTAAGLGYLEVD
jgi:hypothetical protein